MREAKFGCVQGKARGAAFIDNRRALQWAIVDALAADGMAEFPQMDANLVRAPRLQPARDERVSGQGFLDGDVGDGFFAGVFQRRTTAPAVAAIAHQNALDRSRRDLAFDDSEIAPHDGVLAELMSQAALR